MSTSRVEVGTPSVSLSGWTTTEVSFHGFAALPTTRDDENIVQSPEFSCLDHQWVLVLYPGGASNSRGHAAAMLLNMSNKSIKLQWGFSVRDANGKELVYHKPDTDKFTEANTRTDGWCLSKISKRSTLMDALVDGSLVIEVRMKSTTIDNKSITQFIPTNPINKHLLKLFMDEETADVVFEVGEQQQSKGRHKRAKSTTNFHAHRLILKNNASTLYEMCRKSDGEGTTTVSITDVTPKVFKHMIYYAYGGNLSDEDLNNNAKGIIDACDKYGVVHLKLEAEASYVKSNEITIDNMIDNLLYADSKNLALLKEAVMDFIIANKGDIMGKVSFSNVPGDMMTDLLAAMARGEQGVDGDTDYNEMRVGKLRKMLDEKGLDVDGSRESMIALLKENNANS